MSDEIEKLKYHISILKNSVKFYDIDGLAVKLDFSKSQFDDLCKICEEFEHKIENDKKFNFYEFEGELKDKFSIGYQNIKMIIDDFVEYEYCVELAYIYTLLVPNPMKNIKRKYQQLANGTPDEQEMKRFIDEVVANSRNREGK